MKILLDMKINKKNCIKLEKYMHYNSWSDGNLGRNMTWSGRTKLAPAATQAQNTG